MFRKNSPASFDGAKRQKNSRSTMSHQSPLTVVVVIAVRQHQSILSPLPSKMSFVHMPNEEPHRFSRGDAVELLRDSAGVLQLLDGAATTLCFCSHDRISGGRSGTTLWKAVGEDCRLLGDNDTRRFIDGCLVGAPGSATFNPSTGGGGAVRLQRIAMNVIVL